MPTTYFTMFSTKFYPATSPHGPPVKTGFPQSYNWLPPHIAHNLLYHVFHKVVSSHLPHGPQVKTCFPRSYNSPPPHSAHNLFTMFSTKFHLATSPHGPQVNRYFAQCYNLQPPHIAHNMLHRVYHKVVSGHLPTWTTSKNMFFTKLQFTTSPHCPQPFVPCFPQNCIWQPPHMDHKWKQVFHKVIVYYLPTLPTTYCTMFSTKLYPATSPHGPQVKTCFP